MNAAKCPLPQHAEEAVTPELLVTTRRLEQTPSFHDRIPRLTLTSLEDRFHLGFARRIASRGVRLSFRIGVRYHHASIGRFADARIGFGCRFHRSGQRIPSHAPIRAHDDPPRPGYCGHTINFSGRFAWRYKVAGDVTTGAERRTVRF